MANSGDFINFSALGTAKIGDTINKDNPGAKGTSYVMVSPSFACWARTDSTPLFGTEPKIWANFAYWINGSWKDIYAGNQGANTSVQFNVNYHFDSGDKTYNYGGPTTPVLFQAKRLQGYGNRTHCRWIFMQSGHAGESWYNTYIKGKKIYGLSDARGIYTASEGGLNSPSIETVQKNLPLIGKGTPIGASYINMITCLPWGYTG